MSVRVCGCVCAKLLQSCPTLWPYGLWPTRLPCPQDSPAGIYWSGRPRPPPGNLLRDWTRISFGSCIAGGFFTTEPPEKPNTYTHTSTYTYTHNIILNIKQMWQYHCDKRPEVWQDGFDPLRVPLFWVDCTNLNAAAIFLQGKLKF